MPAVEPSDLTSSEAYKLLFGYYAHLSMPIRFIDPANRSCVKSRDTFNSDSQRTARNSTEMP